MSVAILMWNCSSTFTVTLIDDDDQKPISDVEPLILDENGKDVLIENIRTDVDGKLVFDLSEIRGDSFLVSIENDNYFSKKEWVDPFSGEKEKDIFLSQRMTMITGVVLDDSTYSGVSNCKVSTSPAIMNITKTDSSGFFQLKSKQFANIPYTIIFEKPPEYESNTTNIKPILKEINSLELAIFLARKKDSINTGMLEGLQGISPPKGIDPPVTGTKTDAEEEDE